MLCDSGASLLGGKGGQPRLYVNDGAGFFAEAPLQLPAAVKRAHMDTNLVDIDGDFDLDLDLPDLRTRSLMNGSRPAAPRRVDAPQNAPMTLGDRSRPAY